MTLRNVDWKDFAVGLVLFAVLAAVVAWVAIG